MKSIIAVEIALATFVPENTTIGLYSVEMKSINGSAGVVYNGAQVLRLPELQCIAYPGMGWPALAVGNIAAYNGVYYTITSITILNGFWYCNTSPATFPAESSVYVTIYLPSVFRWSTEVVSGTTKTWAVGILTGVGDITKKIDLSSGGAVAQYSGGALTLNSTSQLMQTVKASGIRFVNLPVTIYELEGTATDSDAAITELFSGVLEDATWSETEVSLPIKSSRYKRNAFFGTIISNGEYATLQDMVQAELSGTLSANRPFANDDMNGKLIPCTFGTIDKAKLVRTASAELEFVVNGSIKTTLSGVDYYETWLTARTAATQYKLRYPAASLTYGDITVFPVIAYQVLASDGFDIIYPTWYTIKISAVAGTLWMSTDTGATWSQVTTGITSISCDTLVGRYFKCINGTGSIAGRVVSSAVIDDTNCMSIKITLSDVFETSLIGNATADYPATTSGADATKSNSWVKLLDIKRTYEADVWQCKSLGIDV